MQPLANAVDSCPRGERRALEGADHLMDTEGRKITEFKAGERVAYVVITLEMRDRPVYPRPDLPAGHDSTIVAAQAPPPWYFLALYDAVGQQYEWVDQHRRPHNQLTAWLAEPGITLYTLLRAGWPHGFFMLDRSETRSCELVYFGLVPEAIGQGLGTFLLSTAVHTAWDHPETDVVTVQTCSLDHPRALPLYRKAGFVPVRRDARTRVLTGDRELIEL